jgi:outer membrane lipoprotein carrier protein
MHSSLKVLGAFVLLCASAAAAEADARARAVADQVDAKYNRLQSLKMDFAETYAGGGRIRKESGTLWLKKPGKMRWDYSSPTPKLFLSDGKTAFFYVPGERQARKTSLKNLDDLRSPLRYLLGKAKLVNEFENLTIVPGAKLLRPENVVLGGVPKRLKDRVQQVLFEINPQSQIERLTIEEVDGTETEFTFSGIEEAPKVADDWFKFQRPQNVELIEAKEISE